MKNKSLGFATRFKVILISQREIRFFELVKRGTAN